MNSLWCFFTSTLGFTLFHTVQKKPHTSWPPVNRQGNNHQRPCTLGQWQRQQLILSTFISSTWSDRPPYLGITRKQPPKTLHTWAMTETAVHPQYFHLKHLVWPTSLPGHHKETTTKDPAHLGNDRDSSSSSVLSSQAPGLTDLLTWASQGNNHQRPCTLGQWQRQQFILSTFISSTWSDRPPYLGITRKQPPKTLHTWAMTETAVHPQYFHLKHLVWPTSLPGHHKETTTEDPAHLGNDRDSSSSSVFATETPGLTDHLIWVSQGKHHSEYSDDDRDSRSSSGRLSETPGLTDHLTWITQGSDHSAYSDNCSSSVLSSQIPGLTEHLTWVSSAQV